MEVDRRLSRIRTEWSGNDFTLGLMLDELDGVVRRASVVSADRLLNQVVRVGRTTARALGKDVELKVRGDAILDATIEQRLESSLLHVIRNAIDHGIEDAEKRRALGKPARGSVEVVIGQTESGVHVEVSDDGGGVNVHRLRKVLAGRVPNLDALSDQELLPCLFEQGVTTAEQVTSISGRGVGLDVVAREVAAAGGQIRIESNRNLGTRILLDLPTTLRGEIAVPLRSGSTRYAVPSRSVHSVVRIESIEHTADGDFVRVTGDGGSQLVRLFSLNALSGEGSQPGIGKPAVVLYRAAGLFALAVDGYDNPRPITVKRVDELPFRSDLVRGVAPTPDGEVLLLLDVEAVYSYARARRSAPSVEPRRVPRVQRALVVEDAPVARELLCNILRGLGLSVTEATDGRQGLAMVKADPPDLILTDVEMPYMDGIDFVRELKRDTDLLPIPVIVLTTAATRRNREHLEQLGVTALLSKQRFVEEELRRLVERCLSRHD
jgi:two-component system chemotaxis sensor kinase CheA